MDPWNLQFLSLQTHTHTRSGAHTPFPIHGVGQQVYWILMISGPASPWLISGCRFSVVYLILSFCLHPSIVSLARQPLWEMRADICRPCLPLLHPSPARPPWWRASGYGKGRLCLLVRACTFVWPCVCGGKLVRLQGHLCIYGANPQPNITVCVVQWVA